MSRRGSKNKFIPDLALGTTVFAIALLLVGLVLLRSQSARSMGAQRCLIDGMAAEWRCDRRGRNICNCGHFRTVGQKPHTRCGGLLVSVGCGAQAGVPVLLVGLAGWVAAGSEIRLRGRGLGW
jgi:hypothetical protein